MKLKGMFERHLTIYRQKFDRERMVSQLKPAQKQCVISCQRLSFFLLNMVLFGIFLLKYLKYLPDLVKFALLFKCLRLDSLPKKQICLAIQVINSKLSFLHHSGPQQLTHNNTEEWKRVRKGLSTQDDGLYDILVSQELTFIQEPWDPILERCYLDPITFHSD